MTHNQPISFIHLSDIHFNKYSSDYYDLDSELQNELLLDIESNAKSVLSNIKGILVCGDIAFSGQKMEYDNASIFLKNLCKKLEIPESMVFCVPGNHDINRYTCKSSRIISCIQNDIESSCTQCEISNKIYEFMHDKNANILYEPLVEYNEFASKFGCNISPNKPYWDSLVSINSTYNLRLQGLNSVIISSDKDQTINGHERKMIIGNYQIPKRMLDTITLTLCHHPPECWNDPNVETANFMKMRSHIQLYGHKHIPTVKHNEQTIVIGSGAMQPSRSEAEWVPYYNWISFNIVNDNSGDFLEVRIYPRIYTVNNSMEFVSDANACDLQKDYKVYRLKIRENDEPLLLAENLPEEEIDEKEKSKPEQMDDFINKRTFVYDFMGLPQIVRTQLLSQFNLLRDGEHGDQHNTMLDVIISRAIEAGCMEKLWDEIRKRTA